MEEIRLAALLCSRLCHDLIGPIGAVSNGVELLYEETDPEMRRQALDLVAMSAGEAAHRIEFYRVAFGAASGLGGDIEANEVRRIACALFEHGRVRLDWPEHPDPSMFLAIEVGKLALNMILLAAGTLPRGGIVTVALGEAGEALELLVSAAGERAAMDQDVIAALGADTPGAVIEPRTAQPYLAARLAERLGGSIEVSEDVDRIGLSTAIAAAPPSD
jgi:histidine phosphotransferase ChpT